MSNNAYLSIPVTAGQVVRPWVPSEWEAVGRQVALGFARSQLTKQQLKFELDGECSYTYPYTVGGVQERGVQDQVKSQ